MYTRIDNAIIRRLGDIVGPENLLTDPERMEDYAHDENPNLRADPGAVVKPTTEEEIARLVTLANREGFPVVARGGGTGVTGGALPLHGGAVISLERMNRVLDIDEENMMAIVQPGIVTGDFHQAVEARGVFYPPDPASLENCSLGGNLAEDAGGPRAVKYGVTRDYISGIRAVLPTGEIINYGGKLAKNATGYNLLHLLIGSEGTLGIITEITARLLVRPVFRVDLLVPFPSCQAAVHCVSAVIRRHLTPTAIEFMDRKCLEISRQVLEEGITAADAEAHLLIEVDGMEENEVERRYEAIGELCLEAGADDVIVADSKKNQDKIWNTRRKLRDSLRAVSPIISAQDVVVPRREISALMAGTEIIGRRHRLEIVSFGHAGDGNIHVNFLKRDMDDRQWSDVLRKATGEVFALAVELGGTISGEHGIGLSKRDYLPLALMPAAIESMRRIKHALDPNNILNPGKIFPLSRQTGREGKF
ncbi:MAG: FAD-linked oxidase C-terminal domain-containing protein [PVC group bacterium]